MRIDIVTLFPELCDSFLHASILGRAADKGLFEAHCHQIRDYTKNKQKQTDDYPYGGGCGMVLYAQPIADCIRAVQAQCAEQGRSRPHVAFLTAAGAPYNEQTARRLAGYDSLILVCGHYEGIDERVIEAFGDEEISIGDYVLTGGELASLVVADSVLRLQPGVLAEEKGYQEESYWDGLIEYPQYTRPEVWEGRAVPPVLLTGDHDKIDAWRGKQSRARTRARRPDLYDRWCRTHPLTPGSWKRNERAALVRTEEQLEAAARVYSESWQQSHEEICPPDFVAEHTPLAMRQRLDADRAAGWAFYLHSTAGRPDGIVGVCHKTGEIGRLYVLPAAQGRGIGAKLLEFARKKLPEHAHPFVTVLASNRAAIALYLRMGYREEGGFTNFLQQTDQKFSDRVPEVKLVYTSPKIDKTGV